MLNILFQAFVLMLPLAAHLIHDVPEINKGKSPAHSWDVVFLLIIAFGLSTTIHAWSVPHVSWWQYIIFAMAIHFSLLNYILNLLRKPREPLFYLGDGPWDRLLALAGPPWSRILLQIVVVLTGYGVYAHLDWIKGENLPWNQ